MKKWNGMMLALVAVAALVLMSGCSWIAPADKTAIRLNTRNTIVFVGKATAIDQPTADEWKDIKRWLNADLEYQVQLYSWASGVEKELSAEPIIPRE